MSEPDPPDSPHWLCEDDPVSTVASEQLAFIDALAQPGAYPYNVTDIAVCQTHISVVFLAGPYAYKVKKAVDLGFLDFRTPEQRRHFCSEEVRLNRRLAPAVYLGVVPITHDDGHWQFEGSGPPRDWAVKMHRLPEEATLRQRLLHDQVQPADLEALARRLAEFHRGAARGPHIADFGRFAVVDSNARENFLQTARHVGRTVSPAVYERVRRLTEQELQARRDLIEARAARGVPCDTHGDLHLDHVYHFPGDGEFGEWVIVDCIEFADRFRYADPVADMAFLYMDLLGHARRDLARSFADAYCRASDDVEGQALLPFYSAYRALVRAKVEGVEADERDVQAEERNRARVRARAHWLLALGELEAPARRPALVLVGGLPGSGKSTLARALAPRASFHVLRSDVIRKELAGLPSEYRVPPTFGEGIYSPAWTEDTYAELLHRVESLLWNGQRVLVDASCRSEWQRKLFVQAAHRWGVPVLSLQCQVDPATTRARLRKREGDASDADWEVYQRTAATWEAPSPATLRVTRPLHTEGTIEEVTGRALAFLAEAGLF
jgi:aminoglycoside phosphotransferase family enzyme/predicted kinase